jgi:hypothetical protein
VRRRTSRRDEGRDELVWKEALIFFQPPLHVAAFVGSSELVNLLLDAGADINFTDTKNQVIKTKFCFF